MRYPSPLRYPGGKTILSEFLTDVIDQNDLRGCAYFEPYAGGAGAALTLLKNGVVPEVYLNDADVRIYAFWRAALHRTDRFVERIASVPLTIAEWRRQHEICSHPSKYRLFDVGFAAFYMNRCNRSGVLTGSGPIGGYEQSGAWSMGVRFYRDTLTERILRLSRMRKNIHVSRKDAIDFLKTNLPRGRGRKRVFVYIDPPYVNKGQRLYLNAYEAKDHKFLAKYLRTQKTLPWIMSYDDSALVRELYQSRKVALLPIRYSLQSKRSAQELIIAPDNIVMPSTCRMGRDENPLSEIA
ncbi:MAG: DNA adenine methylase [candidate division Zixibacteria bacterium]|nr:DNA adenine methylase [candidate division Zixibacteria bacterium]MDH3938405.1 DNA adenine methylase [candidate division Zixibacteria bacterium]